MKWLITAHAVERLIERFDRTISNTGATAILTENLPNARRLAEKTFSGQTQWEFDFRGERVRVISKYDKAIRQIVAVTVVRIEEKNDLSEEETDDMVSAYRRQMLAGV